MWWLGYCGVIEWYVVIWLNAVMGVEKEIVVKFILVKY